MTKYFTNNPLTKRELTIIKTIVAMLVLNMCI